MGEPVPGRGLAPERRGRAPGPVGRTGPRDGRVHPCEQPLEPRERRLFRPGAQREPAREPLRLGETGAAALSMGRGEPRRKPDSTACERARDRPTPEFPPHPGVNELRRWIEEDRVGALPVAVHHAPAQAVEEQAGIVQQAARHPCERGLDPGGGALQRDASRGEPSHSLGHPPQKPSGLAMASRPEQPVEPAAIELDVDPSAEAAPPSPLLPRGKPHPGPCAPHELARLTPQPQPVPRRRPAQGAGAGERRKAPEIGVHLPGGEAFGHARLGAPAECRRSRPVRMPLEKAADFLETRFPFALPQLPPAQIGDHERIRKLSRDLPDLAPATGIGGPQRAGEGALRLRIPRRERQQQNEPQCRQEMRERPHGPGESRCRRRAATGASARGRGAACGIAHHTHGSVTRTACNHTLSCRRRRSRLSWGAMSGR